MADPVRYYPYIAELSPHVAELLLIPFYRGDIAIGTDLDRGQRPGQAVRCRRYPCDDQSSLFASAAVRTHANLDAIEAGSRSLREAQNATRFSPGRRDHRCLDMGYRQGPSRCRCQPGPSIIHSPEQARGEKLESSPASFIPTTGNMSPTESSRPWNPASTFMAEYRVIQHDGQIRWIDARGKVERDLTGKAIALPGIITDITDRKRAEQDRERLLGQLQEHDKQKNEFLAMLAHELRNPLAAISNAVMLMTLTDVKEHRDYSTETIQRQTRHLSRLIDDLLDISRINLGKFELRREILDATPILDSAAQTVKTLVEERKHTLDMTIDRGNLWVDADPTRLEQVVVNLLNNAAKYSENGGHIRLSAGHEGGDVVIRVKDAGIGIPPEKLPEMFRLFTQGDRSSPAPRAALASG